MQLNMTLLQHTPLFKGIPAEELNALFTCIGARQLSYGKNEFIFFNGTEVNAIGIVLTGRVQVIKEDVFGNRAVLNNLGPGSVFGESFVCSATYALTVSVLAAEAAGVLFIPFDRVMHICPSACRFHNAVIKNMVEMLAYKNVKLIEKLEVTTKHSLREKILTYLSQLAQEQAGTTVRSPLGRIDLADFLGADRSSLTRELNRMKKEGLINYDKNTYTLLDVTLT